MHPLRRRKPAQGKPWLFGAVETAGLLVAGVVAVIYPLGRFAEWFGGAGSWLSTLPFALAVLALGLALAAGLGGWILLRRRLSMRHVALPAAFAASIGMAAAWLATGPLFRAEAANLRALLGGRAEAERRAIAHQVYAAYRRASLVHIERMFERARPFEPTVLEAARAFDVEPEVLMGVGATESSFRPRDSADGGIGLFQITSPPAEATSRVQLRLGAPRLDPRSHRHNIFLGAATLRVYLDETGGDLFLGLLAYNIGPQNGGMRAIMDRYGARDFVTIQPYLKDLPRDYPIRVLSAALAYRLWRREGRLLRYEEGDNAHRIQAVGIPGFDLPG